MFSTLCLEISARCNRRCSFCPVSYHTREDELMDWSLVEKAANELGQAGYSARVEFYIYNEPMRKKEYLKQCVQLFRKVVPKSCLMIATNGDYFKSFDDVLQCYEWGLNQVLINCYSPGLMEKRSQWMTPSLLNQHNIRTDKSVYLKASSKSRILSMEDKSNPDSFGTGVFSLVNRAGNIPQFLPAVKEPLKRMCVKPFRLLNINWKGEALVCCMDYYGDVSFGNLRTATLAELWADPVLARYRTNLLAKDRTLPLCRDCDCYAGAYPHNVNAPLAKPASVTAVETLYAQKKTRNRT